MFYPFLMGGGGAERMADRHGAAGPLSAFLALKNALAFGTDLGKPSDRTAWPREPGRAGRYSYHPPAPRRFAAGYSGNYGKPLDTAAKLAVCLGYGLGGSGLGLAKI